MAPSTLISSLWTFNGTEGSPKPPIPSPSSLLNGQSNVTSVQDILFGVLSVLLAVASVILTYLQLSHMRAHARGHIPDLEMIESRELIVYLP